MAHEHVITDPLFLQTIRRIITLNYLLYIQQTIASEHRAIVKVLMAWTSAGSAGARTNRKQIILETKLTLTLTLTLSH